MTIEEALRDPSEKFQTMAAIYNYILKLKEELPDDTDWRDALEMVTSFIDYI